jgi:hypothetical protein
VSGTEQQAIGKAENVRAEGLGGGKFEHAETTEDAGVEPRGVREKRFVINGAYCGFEMEAAGDLDGDDLVTVVGDYLRERLHARFISGVEMPTYNVRLMRGTSPPSSRPSGKWTIGRKRASVAAIDTHSAWRDAVGTLITTSSGKTIRNLTLRRLPFLRI